MNKGLIKSAVIKEKGARSGVRLINLQSIRDLLEKNAWRGGPYDPQLRWITFESWESEPSCEQIATVHRRALADERLFQTCEHCATKHNVGHMHSLGICQGCAERLFGGVY